MKVKQKKNPKKGTKPVNLAFPNKAVSVIASDKIVSTIEIVEAPKEIIKPIIGTRPIVNSEPPKETSGPIVEQEPVKDKEFSFENIEITKYKFKTPKKGFYYYWKTFLAWLKTKIQPKLKASDINFVSTRIPSFSDFDTFPKSPFRDPFRNTECIQFNIINTTNKNQKFSLFHNANKNVKIHSGATGLIYERLIELMKYEGAFSCDLTRISSNNCKQITQQVTLLSEKSTGESCSQPLIAQNYFSAYQFQSGIIDIQFKYTVDVALQMLFVILPKTSFTITLYKAKKGDCISSYDCLLNMQGFTRKQEVVKPTFRQKLKQLFKK